MKKFSLALASLALLGGAALTTGSASAAPIPAGGLQSSTDVTQVRMMRSDRMMMKKRMMRKQMMKKQMMKKRMMKRGM